MKRYSKKRTKQIKDSHDVVTFVLSSYVVAPPISDDVVHQEFVPVKVRPSPDSACSAVLRDVVFHEQIYFRVRR